MERFIGTRANCCFSDISVDPTTGMITLRAAIPHPENLLMPGLFARAQIVEGIDANALNDSARTVTPRRRRKSTVLIVNMETKLNREQSKSNTSLETQSSWRRLKAGARSSWKVHKKRSGFRCETIPFSAGPQPIHELSRSPIRNFMAQFLATRPHFCMGRFHLILVLGSLAITQLPVAQYPSVAPASRFRHGELCRGFRGNIAETVTRHRATTQRNRYLLYMSSSSDASGVCHHYALFFFQEPPGHGTVQVQNKLQLATPSLPQTVRNKASSWRSHA